MPPTEKHPQTSPSGLWVPAELQRKRSCGLPKGLGGAEVTEAGGTCAWPQLVPGGEGQVGRRRSERGRECGRSWRRPQELQTRGSLSRASRPEGQRPRAAEFSETLEIHMCPGPFCIADGVTPRDGESEGFLGFPKVSTQQRSPTGQPPPTTEPLGLRGVPQGTPAPTGGSL